MDEDTTGSIKEYAPLLFSLSLLIIWSFIVSDDKTIDEEVEDTSANNATHDSDEM